MSTVITLFSQHRAGTGKRPCVLIVESRQDTRTLLEMTLSQEGVRVFSALNLSSALLQLRVLQPDLIIIGFDRCDAGECSAVAQISRLSAAPVLALGDAADASLGASIADTLSFPLQAGQLCAKVAGLLNAAYEPDFR